MRPAVRLLHLYYITRVTLTQARHWECPGTCGRCWRQQCQKVTVGVQATIEGLIGWCYGMITMIYPFWTGTTDSVMCDKASNLDPLLQYHNTTDPVQIISWDCLHTPKAIPHSWSIQFCHIVEYKSLEICWHKCQSNTVHHDVLHSYICKNV